MQPNSNPAIYYVMIVDHHKEDHLFLQKAINKMIPQAIVESIYDSTEAYTCIDKCAALPDLIFLDPNMFMVSGEDAISRIRRNAVLNKVPVIILSAAGGGAEEKSTLIQKGASQYYSKPGTPVGFMEMVKEVKTKWLI